MRPRPSALGRVAALGAGDLACLQARGAHGEALAGAGSHERADGLHVRVPPAVGAAVGVRDGHAEARALAADIADAGHDGLLDRYATSERPATCRATRRVLLAD